MSNADDVLKDMEQWESDNIDEANIKQGIINLVQSYIDSEASPKAVLRGLLDATHTFAIHLLLKIEANERERSKPID